MVTGKGKFPPNVDTIPAGLTWSNNCFIIFNPLKVPVFQFFTMPLQNFSLCWCQWWFEWDIQPNLVQSKVCESFRLPFKGSNFDSVFIILSHPAELIFINFDGEYWWNTLRLTLQLISFLIQFTFLPRKGCHHWQDAILLKRFTPKLSHTDEKLEKLEPLEWGWLNVLIQY